MLELNHHGFGPVHNNVETKLDGTFDVKKIDYVHQIYRVNITGPFPDILDKKKIAVFVGAHSKWSADLTEKVNSFCEQYNAIVIGDHTSNYKGPYFVPSSLIINQRSKKRQFQILI